MGSEKTKMSSEAARLPLFYKQPTPLSPDRHAGKYIRPSTDLSFARETNAIPITLAEFASVSRHYPIAFVDAVEPFPVAIVGLRKEENLFINEVGAWTPGVYIPAYVRRYPFVLLTEDGSDQLTLAIDEASERISGSEGAVFFEEDGKPSVTTADALEFCRSYHSSVKPTEAFAAALEAHGLLASRQTSVTRADGEVFNLSGFKLVDADKLRQLDAATAKTWLGNGWLMALHAHQISQHAWSDLADRV
ncbi:SapC family protein [Pyruvatibacter mobilis]|uniref:SapC family protein n=1 Tax=Pyruvatibacter mobilis TaxID=1712261 RepID=UPI003BAC15D6